MRKLKPVSWLCFAGICCAGLWMAAGAVLKGSSAQAGTDETAQGGTVNCPIGLYWYFNGMYYYAVGTPDINGNCRPMGYIVTDAPHTVGCPDCPDPILGRPTPFPKSDNGLELAPKPDPLFSG